MKKILVIDDQSVILSLFERFAEFLDYEGLYCENADCVDNIPKNELAQIDLIIMDLFMDQLNGVDFSKKLKNDYPDIKIVISSGDEFELEKAYHNNPDIIDDYLAKPFTIDAVKELLSRFGWE